MVDCPKCGQEAESRINNNCYCNYCGYEGMVEKDYTSTFINCNHCGRETRVCIDKKNLVCSGCGEPLGVRYNKNMEK